MKALVTSAIVNSGCNEATCGLVDSSCNDEAISVTIGTGYSETTSGQ